MKVEFLNGPQDGAIQNLAPSHMDFVVPYAPPPLKYISKEQSLSEELSSQPKRWAARYIRTTKTGKHGHTVFLYEKDVEW